jgi:RNA polymerase sigma factor (TIGR02999 family)
MHAQDLCPRPLSFHGRDMEQERSIEAGEFTCLLQDWRQGDARAQEQLFNLIYHELKGIAVRRLSKSAALSLNSTELVNESLLRLLERVPDAKSREHFFKIAATAIRCTLIDLSRRQYAEKRGSGVTPVTLSFADHQPVSDAQWLDVEMAFIGLDRQDPRKCRIAELSLLVGLSQEEIAAALAISLSTVERDLRFAKAWLRERLSP